MTFYYVLDYLEINIFNASSQLYLISIKLQKKKYSSFIGLGPDLKLQYNFYEKLKNYS
jgi:hypothetical protein